MKRVFGILVVLTMGLVGLQAAVEVEASPDFSTYTPWDKETVDLFASLPVQDGGRIKPMDSIARFAMFRMHQVRGMSFVLTDKEKGTSQKIKLTPTQWLMDVFFRTEQAKHYPTFRINDSDVAIALGITPKKKRDKYSYNELVVARAKLSELGGKYREMQAKDRDSLDRIQTLVLQLNGSVNEFEYLMAYFEFGKKGYFFNADMFDEEARELAKGIVISELIKHMPEVKFETLMQEMQRGLQSSDAEQRILGNTYRLLLASATFSSAIAIIPPEGEDPDDKWLSLGDVIRQATEEKVKREALIPWIASAEAMVTAASEPEKFKTALTSFRDKVNAAATRRDQGGTVALELKYYRWDLFFYSMIIFVLSFVLLTISWLRPDGNTAKLLSKVTTGGAVVATLLIVWGMIVRGMIRDRPAPMTNLYDTVLFITAFSVVLCLIIEWMTKKRIGLALAVILGAGGMLLSLKYEMKDAADNMDPVQAVLDSNFWLLTHVVAINIGYGAGLVAAAFSHIYLLGRLFRFKKDDRDYYRDISRMAYGTICFALFFSLVGTVLGGIWANYSWGRFWGWDPKENGALLIVLWCLVVIHARAGGYVREIGVNVLSVFLAMVIVFSWWGVNNLGVGLHSYGFTDGLWLILGIYWGGETLVMAAGLILSARDGAEKRLKKELRKQAKSEQASEPA
ncbi:MAG: cytochrome c biogenesis protein CcsA [Verrucomicrobiales bacterium]|nr:cytochrome c biogenesis protein CcsA [Verrucomicrobiales bacterium]